MQIQVTRRRRDPDPGSVTWVAIWSPLTGRCDAALHRPSARRRAFAKVNWQVDVEPIWQPPLSPSAAKTPLIEISREGTSGVRLFASHF